jgi:uncharacterized membrane protein
MVGFIGYLTTVYQLMRLFSAESDTGTILSVTDDLFQAVLVKFTWKTLETHKET